MTPPNQNSDLELWLGRIAQGGAASADLLTAVEQALDRNSLDCQTVCRLAAAALTAGHEPLSVGLAKAVLDREPEAPVALAIRGCACAANGDREKAVTAFHLALAAGGEEVCDLLAAASADKAKESTVWAALLSVFERLPHRPDQYRSLALALDRAGRQTRAVELLELAVRREAADTESRELLAHVYYSAGRGEEAIAVCHDVLRSDSRRLPMLELLCAACLQTGRMDEATAALRTQLALTPMDPTLHFRLGALHQQQGRLREALHAFTQVESLTPGSELAAAAVSSMAGIDNAQFQRIMVLAAEDRQFQVKLRRDAAAALAEYDIALSPRAMGLAQVLDFDGLLKTITAPLAGTHH